MTSSTIRFPKEKILLNKRVLTILNSDIGARVGCTDGSTFDGDIIVGADGAYSPVRQGLFNWLKKSNKLPSSDDVPTPYKHLCLVGQTRELDLDEFPEIEQSTCNFDYMTSITTPYTVQTNCNSAIFSYCCSLIIYSWLYTSFHFSPRTD